ncbi:MAG: RNA polymerase sigma factor [Chitinophagaceae bacterium]|nr:RNA polymerase sigma factor [Chitinophagaceae bacterium]
MTEQELISQLQQGEEQAFKLLVNRYQDKVFNTAFGLLQQHGDAEDIAQEVFIQVYRSVHQFKGAAALSTWLYRITVTKCLDHIRSKKRKKRFGFTVSMFGADNQPVYEAANFHHPGVALDKKEDAAMLFKMIDDLPENQKTAFVLNKLEDLSYLEIARIMKTTESAVDSLLQRARQNLKKAVAAKINNSS